MWPQPRPYKKAELFRREKFKQQLNTMAHDTQAKMPRAKGHIPIFFLVVFVFLGLITLILSITITLAVALWADFIVVVILAATYDKYTWNATPLFHGQITRGLSGGIGVWFPGLTFRWPWVKPEGKPFDLRTELHAVITSTFTTQIDGLAMVTFIFSLRIDIRHASKSIILFAGNEAILVQEAGNAIISQLLSDWFLKNRRVFKIAKSEIQKQALEMGEGLQKIQAFERQYGVVIHAILKDVDPDAKVQEARDLIARTKSVGEATKALVRKDWSQVEAEKFVKLAQLPNAEEQIYTVNVEGLQNLQNITMLAPPSSNKKRN